MNKRAFKAIVDAVFVNRKQIRLENGISEWNLWCQCYIPHHIDSKMSPEAFDAMEIVLHKEFKSKRDFASAYKKQLFELGEKVGR